MLVKRFKGMVKRAGLSAAQAGITLDGTHPRDPVIRQILGLGRETSAGVRVDHEAVLAIPAVKRAVQIITDKMFGMPWYVFEEQSDGREFAQNHPAWRCMRTRANSEMTAAQLRRQLTQWAMGHGNGCAVIEFPPGWPASGDIELFPLNPKRTSLVRVSEAGIRATGTSDLLQPGALRYVTTIGQEEFAFAPDRIFHIKGMGESGLWGYDLVTLLVEAFGGTIAKEQYTNRFFGQGAMPAGFIEMDGSLGSDEEDERFRESLRKAMHGLGKAHQAILLEEGAKYKSAGIDPEKSQLIEGRQFDVRTMAMVIGIKAHKLIDSANSSFASLEQSNQEHKDDDLLPWVNRWQDESQSKLLREGEWESGSHSIGVDDEYLEFVPFEQRVNGAVTMVNNGLATRDEARRKVNFGPSRSSRANAFRIPSNIVYEDDLPAGSTVPSEDVRGSSLVVRGSEEQPRIEGPEEQSEPGGASPGCLPAGDEADTTAVTWAAAEAERYRTRLTKKAESKAKAGQAAFCKWMDDIKHDAGPEQAPEGAPEQVQAAMDQVHEEFCGEVEAVLTRVKTDAELREAVSGLEIPARD